MKHLIFLFLFSCTMLHAQEWTSIYNNSNSDYSFKITVDEQNNSYITGSTDSSDFNSRLLIVKYNPSGVQQWAIVYSHSTPIRNSIGYAIKYDNSGNLYIGGEIEKIDSSHEILLLKYSTSGNQIWVRTFDRTGTDDNFLGLTLDDAGNPYVLGNYNDLINFTGGTEIIRYNQQGDTLWTFLYDNANGSVIKADAAGNSYVTGSIFQNIGLLECLTYKVDATGNLMWFATYGSSDLDFGYSLCIEPGGDVYVSGHNGFLDDVFLVKYNSLGSELWVQTYGGPEDYYEGGFLTDLDNAGNVYIAGRIRGGDTLRNILVLKYSPAGNRLWASIFSDTSRQVYASEMVVSGEGNVFITGSSVLTDDDSGVLTLIYNTSGVLQWKDRYQGTATSNNGHSLSLDANSNIYITGYSINANGNFDCLTMKYNNPVGITSSSFEVPQTFSLGQNYPNPFNPVTKINFNVVNSGNVKITVFDILGKEVDVIANEFLSAGFYKASFDGTNFTSGIYFYRLEAGDFTETKKMNLVK